MTPEDVFLDMMLQFLQSLSTAFPTCVHVERYFKAFKLGMHGMVTADMRARCVREYVDVMAPYFDRCTQRDESLLGEDILFLSRLSLPLKWGVMDAETKDVVWLYINELNTLAQGCEPVGTVACVQPEFDVANYCDTHSGYIEACLESGNTNPMNILMGLMQQTSEGEKENITRCFTTPTGEVDKAKVMELVKRVVPPEAATSDDPNVVAAMNMLRSVSAMLQ
jgi:hypothetical protein